jgi:hypothetical protein
MDSRRKDDKGNTICPQCGVSYKPILGERDDTILIQHQFPNATKEEREQLITGLCSDRCWKRFIGEEG